MATKKCQGCRKKLDDILFIEGEKEYKRCITCRKSRQKAISSKQICYECGRKAFFNFDGQDVGIRCKDHKIQGMINIRGKDYYEKIFQNFVEKLGGKIVGEYSGTRVPVECICKNGHNCKPQPALIQRGQGMCKICVGNDPVTTEQNFIKMIEEMGGIVIGEYKNNFTKIECICRNGHVCQPTSNCIQQGQGMCKICVGKDSHIAEENFFETIEKLGGIVVGEYTNALSKVECICRNGHVCHPIPNSIQQGQGICCQCTQSRGETMLFDALQKLGFNAVSQARHPSIPTLRYDYSVLTEDRIAFLEYHGIQHEKFTPLFHKTEDGFEKSRQRDLLKVYIARKNNIKLIILDHRWTKKPLKEWVNYLKSALENDEKLILNSKIHEWLKNEKPSDDTIAMYVK